MKRQNIKYRGLLGLVMSSIIVSFSGLQLAKAELIPELLISVYFPGGVKRPPTEKTKGGGTRGTFCVTKNDLKEDDLKNYLIPLMPRIPTENYDGTTIYAGTTVSTNPQIFVYVPKHEANLAEFVISDSNKESGEKKLYPITQYNISDTSGIVKLNLPKNVNLTTNQEYTWTFTIICDPLDRSADEFVKGTIEKIEISSDLRNSLENATPLQQAEIYAKAKIWNDTIALVADLRTSNPAEWEAEWKELLESVGLEQIASEPFVPCCQVEE